MKNNKKLDWGPVTPLNHFVLLAPSINLLAPLVLAVLKKPF